MGAIGMSFSPILAAGGLCVYLFLYGQKLNPSQQDKENAQRFLDQLHLAATAVVAIKENFADEGKDAICSVVDVDRFQLEGFVDVISNGILGKPSKRRLVTNQFASLAGNVQQVIDSAG